jgi:hypothetical protein
MATLVGQSLDRLNRISFLQRTNPVDGREDTTSHIPRSNPLCLTTLTSIPSLSLSVPLALCLPPLELQSQRLHVLRQQLSSPSQLLCGLSLQTSLLQPPPGNHPPHSPGLNSSKPVLSPGLPALQDPLFASEGSSNPSSYLC